MHKNKVNNQNTSATVQNENAPQKKLLTIKSTQEKRGFSIFELSMVLGVTFVILGIIFIGKNLLANSRLITARSLTDKSAVQNIKNLVLWLETTSDESFPTALSNNGTVSQWNDLNRQEIFQRNASSSGTYQPTYVQKAINSLPALKFDGINDYMMVSNSNMITGNKLSIFLVIKRTAFVNFGGFISLWKTGAATDWNNSESLGFEDRTSDTGTMGWVRNDTDGSGTVIGNPMNPFPGSNIAFVYSTVFNGTNNYSYYNGSGTGFTNPRATSSKNFNIQNLSIGGRGPITTTCSNCWNGYVGEVIIFDRDLTDSERREVERYLAKKWGIKVASS